MHACNACRKQHSARCIQSMANMFNMLNITSSTRINQSIMPSTNRHSSRPTSAPGGAAVYANATLRASACVCVCVLITNMSFDLFCATVVVSPPRLPRHVARDERCLLRSRVASPSANCINCCRCAKHARVSPPQTNKRRRRGRRRRRRSRRVRFGNLFAPHKNPPISAAGRWSESATERDRALDELGKYADDGGPGRDGAISTRGERIVRHQLVPH